MCSLTTFRVFGQLTRLHIICMFGTEIIKSLSLSFFPFIPFSFVLCKISNAKLIERSLTLFVFIYRIWKTLLVGVAMASFKIKKNFPYISWDEQCSKNDSLFWLWKYFKVWRFSTVAAIVSIVIEAKWNASQFHKQSMYLCAEKLLCSEFPTQRTLLSIWKKNIGFIRNSYNNKQYNKHIK